jgi:hypothetical protein
VLRVQSIFFGHLIGGTSGARRRPTFNPMITRWILLALTTPLFAQWTDLGSNTTLNGAKLAGSPLANCTGSTPPAYCTGTGANYAFATGAHSVLDAWGGAAADTVNNRLIITGGGHVDYNGNQVYILNLNTNVMTIDIAPTGNFSTTSGTEANGDGTPTARHAYEGLVYLPNENSVFYWGDGNAPGGTRSTNIWWYSLTTHSWTEKGVQPDGIQQSVYCAIDPTQATESLLCIGMGSYIMWRYVPSTDSWTTLNSPKGTFVPFEANCAIQPDQKVMICAGASSFGASAGIYSIDITGAASYAAVNITSSTTACSSLYSVNYPGMDYDSSTGLIVSYTGSGNSITTLDVISGICETKTFSGGPTASGTTAGILSKFAYFPKLNQHIVVNNAANDAFALKLSTSTDVTPPTISIVTPASGSTLSNIVNVTASASDNVGVVSVQFMLDATNLGSPVISAPYTVSWNTTSATNGSHTISAVALDGAGNVGTSAGVVVTVSNTAVAPTISLTAPTNGANLSGIINITANASAQSGIANVQFTLDGANLGTPVATAPYTLAWATTGAGNGSHSLSAVATNSLGNSASASPVTVSVTNSTTVSSTSNGLGSSTLTCIDVDGDGYGVGPGCLGPDADDNDATVHTGAQAIAKYGTLNAFLSHLGYNPTRVWYLDMAGNDSTGAVNNPSQPYKTYGAINALVTAGDMVMLRNAWNGRITPPSGSSGHPLIIMSYPGEQAMFDASDNAGETIYMLGTSWLVIDGIKFKSWSCMGGGTVGSAYGGGPASTFHDNVFRHLDAGEGGCAQGGLFFQNGLVNITVEYSVFHDNDCDGGTCQHGIYFGSNDIPSSNVTIRRNLFFNNAWNGIHFNGRVTNLVLEQNIFYNMGVASISFQNGVSSSFIRANLIFNGGAKGIDIDNYESGQCYDVVPGDGLNPICPYDQTNNLFENNTIYMPGFLGDSLDLGTAVQGAPAIQIVNVTTGCGTPTCTPATKIGNLGGNTFRNNIFVVQGDASANIHYPPIIYPACKAGTGGPGQPGCSFDSSETYLATSTFDHNLFYQANGVGGTGVIALGPGTAYGWAAYTCATAGSVTTMTSCLFGDPQFVSASLALWNNIGQFNFHLGSSSPAVNAGSSTLAPMYDLTGALFASPSPSLGPYEAVGSTTTLTCDLNHDGVVNALDVQLAINQALGLAACSSADLQQNGTCSVIDVQRVITASLGGACIIGQ